MPDGLDPYRLAELESRKYLSLLDYYCISTFQAKGYLPAASR